LCAAGVGAPHIRQRLYWMAYADQRERGRLPNGEGRQSNGEATGREQGDCKLESRGHAGGMANNNNNTGLEGRGLFGAVEGRNGESERVVGAGGVVCGMANAGLSERATGGSVENPDSGADRERADNASRDVFASCGGVIGLAHTGLCEQQGRPYQENGSQGASRDEPASHSSASGLADRERDGLEITNGSGAKAGTVNGSGGFGGMAHSTTGGQRIDGSTPRDAGHASQCDAASGMANADGPGQQRENSPQSEGRECDTIVAGAGSLGARRLAYPECVSEHRNSGTIHSPEVSDSECRDDNGSIGGLQTGAPILGPLGGFWAGADWIPCSDGKARPTESGLSPLAHGAAQRVGKLRAYGNSLCAPVAQTFIECVMECLP
jgi:hypothetical protein